MFVDVLMSFLLCTDQHKSIYLMSFQSSDKKTITNQIQMKQFAYTQNSQAHFYCTNLNSESNYLMKEDQYHENNQ